MCLCPCCSSPLLQHINKNRQYWFCNSCRQEMPNFQPDMDNLTPILAHHYLSHQFTLSSSSIIRSTMLSS